MFSHQKYNVKKKKTRYWVQFSSLAFSSSSSSFRWSVWLAFRLPTNKTKPNLVEHHLIIWGKWEQTHAKIPIHNSREQMRIANNPQYELNASLSASRFSMQVQMLYCQPCLCPLTVIRFWMFGLPKIWLLFNNILSTVRCHVMQWNIVCVCGHTTTMPSNAFQAPRMMVDSENNVKWMTQKSGLRHRGERER